jgi:hypothetical protein
MQKKAFALRVTAHVTFVEGFSKFRLFFLWFIRSSKVSLLEGFSFLPLVFVVEGSVGTSREQPIIILLEIEELGFLVV